MTFDPQLATFTVTGSYATSDAPATGHTYTATLYYDGIAFRLLALSGT